MDRRKKLKQFDLLELAESCDEVLPDPSSEAPTAVDNGATNEVIEIIETVEVAEVEELAPLNLPLMDIVSVVRRSLSQD